MPFNTWGVAKHQKACCEWEWPIVGPCLATTGNVRCIESSHTLSPFAPLSAPLSTNIITAGYETIVRASGYSAGPLREAGMGISTHEERSKEVCSRHPTVLNESSGRPVYSPLVLPQSLSPPMPFLWDSAAGKRRSRVGVPSCQKSSGL